MGDPLRGTGDRQEGEESSSASLSLTGPTSRLGPTSPTSCDQRKPSLQDFRDVCKSESSSSSSICDPQTNHGHSATTYKSTENSNTMRRTASLKGFRDLYVEDIEVRSHHSTGRSGTDSVPLFEQLSPWAMKVPATVTKMDNENERSIWRIGHKHTKEVGHSNSNGRVQSTKKNDEDLSLPSQQGSQRDFFYTDELNYDVSATAGEPPFDSSSDAVEDEDYLQEARQRDETLKHSLHSARRAYGEIFGDSAASEVFYIASQLAVHTMGEQAGGDTMFEWKRSSSGPEPSTLSFAKESTKDSLVPADATKRAVLREAAHMNDAVASNEGPSSRYTKYLDLLPCVSSKKVEAKQRNASSMDQDAAVAAASLPLTNSTDPRYMRYRTFLSEKVTDVRPPPNKSESDEPTLVDGNGDVEVKYHSADSPENDSEHVAQSAPFYVQFKDSLTKSQEQADQAFQSKVDDFQRTDEEAFFPSKSASVADTIVSTTLAPTTTVTTTSSSAPDISVAPIYMQYITSLAGDVREPSQSPLSLKRTDGILRAAKGNRKADRATKKASSKSRTLITPSAGVTMEGASMSSPEGTIYSCDKLPKVPKTTNGALRDGKAVRKAVRAPKKDSNKTVKLTAPSTGATMAGASILTRDCTVDGSDELPKARSFSSESQVLSLSNREASNDHADFILTRGDAAYAAEREQCGDCEVDTGINSSEPDILNSLTGETSLHLTDMVSTHDDGAYAAERSELIRSKSNTKAKEAPNNDKLIILGFDDSICTRVDTLEFLGIWNNVESDRFEIQATMPATKEPATKPTIAPSIKDARDHSTKGEHAEMASDDFGDIETGLLSLNANCWDNDDCKARAKAYKQRQQIRYGFLAFLLVALPLGIGLGVAFSGPERTTISAQSLHVTTRYPTTSPVTTLNPSRLMSTRIPSPASSPVTTLNSPSQMPTRIPFPAASPVFTAGSTLNNSKPILTRLPTTLNPSKPLLTRLPSTSNPTQNPSMRQTISRNDENDLFVLLFLETPGHASSVLRHGSPQNLAFHWLKSDPNLFLTYSKQRILQRFALASLYYSTNGNSWLNKRGWLSATNECTWYTRSTQELSCDTNFTYVNLDLSINDVSGTIPPEVALLSSLETLILSAGTGYIMGGTLPSELGLLTQLRVFDVQGNSLSGGIPTQLGDLGKLEVLDLSMNAFAGPISPDLGRMTSLRAWNFAMNQLTGELPTAVNLLTKLEMLSLGNNNLQGTVMLRSPLALLKELYLEKNEFTAIGTEIGLLASLDTFHIYENQLAGPFVSDIGRLSTLQTLNMRTNKLAGPIPTQIGQLLKLTALNLAFNSLTGPIPSAIGLLTKLIDLDLQHNHLEGPLPDALGNLKNASSIRINHNDISGVVPVSVCKSFSNLTPIFRLDCGKRRDGSIELACPPGTCCSFCCSDDGGCHCVYEKTTFAFLCALGA